MIRRLLRAALVFALLTFAFASLAQVSIFAWQENKTDRVVYHYRVVNDLADRVLGFQIGQNDLTSEMQLTVRPVGFVEDELLIPEEMIGLGFPIPAGSATAPAGWTAAFILGDDHVGGAGALHYYVTDDGTPLGIGTLREFTVSVPAANDLYRTGNWVALLERGIRVPGRLFPDSEAPVPTATVSGGGSGCPGTTVQVSALLAGNGPWNLQWSDGLTTIVSSSPVTRTVTPAVATQYSIVRIRDVNRDGTSSGAAFANIAAPATIERQPQSVSIAKRSTATLTVAAGGATPLSYQWYRGLSGQTTTPVGTNSSTFTTPKLTSTTSYWVRVANACGTADSQTATITVR